jgi:hypothetical protein
MSAEPGAGPAVPRLSVAEFLRDLYAELFKPDRGLPYTAAMLCLWPQQVLRGWLERRDPRYVKPFRYFLIAGATAVALGVGAASRPDAPGISDSLQPAPMPHAASAMRWAC